MVLDPGHFPGSPTAQRGPQAQSRVGARRPGKAALRPLAPNCSRSPSAFPADRGPNGAAARPAALLPWVGLGAAPEMGRTEGRGSSKGRAGPARICGEGGGEIGWRAEGFKRAGPHEFAASPQIPIPCLLSLHSPGAGAWPVSQAPLFTLSSEAHPERAVEFPQSARGWGTCALVSAQPGCCACRVKEAGAGGKLAGQELQSDPELPVGREAGRTAPGLGP